MLPRFHKVIILSWFWGGNLGQEILNLHDPYNIIYSTTVLYDDRSVRSAIGEHFCECQCEPDFLMPGKSEVMPGQMPGPDNCAQV